MRRILIAWALLLVGFFCIGQSSAYWQSRDSNYNTAISGGGGCTTTNFALDGTPQVGNASSASSVAIAAFSTSNCSDLVIVGVVGNGGPITSVSDSQSHLTFTQRSGYSVTGGSSTIDEWTAPLSSAALSGDVITVHQTTANFITAFVAAVSGYKTASPFDGNAGIPFTRGSAECQWSTSNANDFLIGVGVNSTTTPDTGFTALYSNSGSLFLLAEYQFVSATQSNLSAPQLGTGSNACGADAIQKGP